MNTKSLIKPKTLLSVSHFADGKHKTDGINMTHPTSLNWDPNTGFLSPKPMLYPRTQSLAYAF